MILTDRGSSVGARHLENCHHTNGRLQPFRSCPCLTGPVQNWVTLCALVCAQMKREELDKLENVYSHRVNNWRSSASADLFIELRGLFARTGEGRTLGKGRDRNIN